MSRSASGGCLGASRGFSLVELAIALAVLAGLLYFLLDRVLYMQEVAEKTEVEETIRSINYGLRLEAASRLARGPNPGQLPLEKDNPIKWLNAPPRNYLGEFAKAPEGAKPGFWYFQLDERRLIYRPNRAERLAIEATKGKELRFEVRMNGGMSQPRLVPNLPYAWFGDRAEVNR